MAFSADFIAQILHDIYQKGKRGSSTDISPALFKTILEQFNKAASEGFHESAAPDPDIDFRQALRHSNEVFSAFKVHRMQKDMANLLIDSNGDLKPFNQWANDVLPIASHQCWAWLQTEYDTAVLRAHQAADWQQFLREADVLPNLKWMPSTSPNPGPDHQIFWNVIRPITDPFWNEHRPGDRWNCKCSLTSTDETPTSAPMGDNTSTPQPGLDANPANDKALFAQSHPYFPSSCDKCDFYKPNVKAKLKYAFTNRKKDCYNCPYIDGCLDLLTQRQKATHKQIKVNREQYQKLVNNPDYKNIQFDERYGGVKATHVGHNFDKNKGWYEEAIQNVGFKHGHSVILENEPQNVYKKKSCEGLWDNLKFEIAGAETATPKNIRNALKHCASKPNAKIAVLFFPNNNFTSQNFQDGFAMFNGLKGTSQYRQFDCIYCIQGYDIIQIKKPS